MTYDPTRQRFPLEMFASGGVRIDKPLPEERQLCFRCERNGNACAQLEMSPTPIATDDELGAWRSYLRSWVIDYPVRARFDAYLDHDSVQAGPILRIRVAYLREPDATDPSVMRPPLEGQGYLAPSRLPNHETPRWLRQQLRYHLDHELDEHLTFHTPRGPVRPFDPHHPSMYICDECAARDAQREP